MDLLEHPLEAVAFRLYSLPEATASMAAGAAAWTCLAAVLAAAAAAAASLWRLRASAPAALTGTTKRLELELGPAEEASPEPFSASERSPEPAAASTTPEPSPKERYTAYYRDGGRVGCCDVGDEEGEEEEEDAGEQEYDDDDGAYQASETTDPFGWEVVRSLPLSPTATEMGRYRGPTALSGSVVRLWDQGGGGGLTPTASPRRRGRVVGTLSAF